jgi:hypothetical protein
MEQMRLAKQKRFGSSSEKSKYDSLYLFNEAEIMADKRMPEQGNGFLMLTQYNLILVGQLAGR